jgi:NAD(P)-dependent dehydrogenase (short-subunit alcohol dehydrogenase family)
MIDRFEVKGEVALVTGASSGLGAHFARVLAGAGASVVLAARRSERLAALAAEIDERGGRAAAVTMDVTDAASVAAGFDAAQASLGTVTLLVNNSGVAVTARSLDLEEAEWDRVLDTNLKGAWLVAREAARRLVAAECGGAIVNIASIVAFGVVGGLGAYAASKAGLVQLTRTMANELARHDIRVNAIAPGYIETEINRGFFQTPAGQSMIRSVPQRRLGDPSDLDGALLLLASKASRYMTGSTVVVDGGHLCTGL